MDARVLIENCRQSALISDEASRLMTAAISVSSLSSVPQEYRDFIRAAMIKQMLLTQI